VRVLRHFDVATSTEGQLALERQADLSATLVRVAAFIQVGLLVLSMLAGDRLSAQIRGAMCGYGVFSASPWGFRSLAATVGTALAAGIVSELYALDARVKTFDLARPLAWATLLLAPIALVDFALATSFALSLDLSVVASCCSIRLDAIGGAGSGFTPVRAGLRDAASLGSVILVSVAIAAAWWASRRPKQESIVAAAAATVLAVPFALAASVLEVAPHAFEIPQHVCPFCLLRPTVLGLGYPLFGAVLLAAVTGIGVGVGALLSRSTATRDALRPFATIRLRRQSAAWAAALLLGALPVVRYAWAAGGRSLFP
jgi:hypothetical protein